MATMIAEHLLNRQVYGDHACRTLAEAPGGWQPKVRVVLDENFMSTLQMVVMVPTPYVHK